VANWNKSEAYALTNGGGSITVVNTNDCSVKNTLALPHAANSSFTMAISPTSGVLAVDWSDTKGYVMIVDPTTGSTQTVDTGLEVADGVAFSADGSLLYSSAN
jgi:sugar lactone lactonase YvrE